VAEVSLLTRARTGDIRSIPIAVWPFLILLLANVWLTVTDFNRPDSVPLSNFLSLAPLVFATAVAYVFPRDRRFLIGAAALALPEIVRTLQLIFAENFSLSAAISAAIDLNWLANVSGWIFEAGGLLLFGMALGGIRTRVGWIAVAVGLALFVISRIEYAFNLAGNPLVVETMPAADLALGFLAGSAVVGWAFLLGAALERGSRALSIGAGILVAIYVVDQALMLVYVLLEPGTTLMPTTWFFSGLRLVAWAALIYGALTELPRARDARENEPETVLAP
jgi:hypothetical protein